MAQNQSTNLPVPVTALKRNTNSHQLVIRRAKPGAADHVVHPNLNHINRFLNYRMAL